MPALTLPLSFTNSFWSQDYRRGLEVLFSKLDQGIAENREIVNFIRARIAIEDTTGTALINPPLTGPQGAGFGADDGASLMMAFLGLKDESKAQGEAHIAIARELEELVVDPFAGWAEEHASRITDAKRTMLDNWLKAYEHEVADVQKLKANYQAKARRADEAEDDAKFAPNNDYGDHYTPTSPRVNQFNGAVKRTASVSERIAQRLKDLRKGVADKTPEAEKSVLWDGQDSTSQPGDEDEQRTPKIDKGKGRAIDPLPESPTPMDAPLPPPKQPSKPTLTVPSSMMEPDPVPMMIADVPMLPGAVSALLIRAEEELPLRPVRFPILGEYPDCFTGEEFVNFLKDAVPGFLGDLERAEDAAIDLTERENLLRRVGELGNEFENSREAFYQFRRKAFELHIEPPSPADSTKSPVALLSGSNAFANLVMKTIGTGGTQQPPHVKARLEAQAADDQYRAAVRKLDRQRLGLEDEIERTLKNLQRWETDRLSAVKTVLLQFHGTLSNLPAGLQPSFERSSTLIASYQPESDIKALIERYRTGPFRPVTHVYESAAHEAADVVFGIDLRRWAGQAGWNDIKLQVEGVEPEPKETVPPVVVALLSALKESYAKFETPAERRKTWIYEVPLPAVHYLREVCNSFPPNDTIPAEVLQKYDAPVLASAVKLWMLELDPPLCLWEGWDEIRKIYPSVGASAERDEAQLVEDLSNALGRFPRIHLLVLDAVVSHLKELIDDTVDDNEEEEVYVTKLALSVGRSILRPKVETEMSIQDRHPTLFFIDLLNHYEEVLPPTIAKKKRDMERPAPSRKRTALVDARLSRSSISGGGADVRQLLEAREAQIAEVSRSRPTSPAPQRTSFGIPGPPPPLPPQKPIVTPASPPVSTPAGGRPAFVDPVDDDDDDAEKPHPVVVSPPTPQRPQSPVSPPRAQSPPAPTSDEDKSISHSQSASVSRSGSGDARVRGPRTLATKGPRPLSSTPPAAVRAASGHAPSRSSVSSSDGLLARADPNDYAPKRHGGRVQAGAFSRRTMASDAEDEVVEK